MTTWLRGRRGLAAWCGATSVLALALLLHRPAQWSAPARAVAIALLAAVGGVLAGRVIVRWAVCAVVGLLGAVTVPHSAVIGVLLLAAAAWGAVAAPGWPLLGRRFEPAGSAAPREDDPWTRLDRGEDPTA